MASIRDWKNGDRAAETSAGGVGMGLASVPVTAIPPPPTAEERAASLEAMQRVGAELAERLGWNQNPDWRQKRKARKTETAPLSPMEREARREMLRRQARELGATIDPAIAEGGDQ